VLLISSKYSASRICSSTSAIIAEKLWSSSWGSISSRGWHGRLSSPVLGPVFPPCSRLGWLSWWSNMGRTIAAYACFAICGGGPALYSSCSFTFAS
jgi:hypothetical protein